MRKLFMLARIVLDPRNIAMYLRIHGLFARDPSYSIGRVLRASLNAIKGERLLAFKGRYLATSFLPPFPSEAFMSVARAAKPGAGIFSDQAYARRTAPISCFIALTDRCDLACEHCSAKGREPGREPTAAEWKGVVRSLQDMGTAIIGFTGGEPLLRDDIVDIVSSVDARSVSILYTNGGRLREALARRLAEAGLFAVAVSLDSADPAAHDARRGVPGSHAAALAALRAASRAGLYPIAQAVVYRQDLDEGALRALFRTARRAGAREVRLLEPIRSGNLAKEGKDIFYAEEDRARLRAIQYRANAWPGMPKITTFAHTESADQYGCGAGTQHSYVGPTGELFPCDFVPLSFGNVLESPVAELWKGMNEAMGIPGTGCFAFKLHAEIADGKVGALPLPREASAALCARLLSGEREYPAFYRIMQGKA